MSAFDRDEGKLRPAGALSAIPGALGCVSDDGSGEECQDGVALAGATRVALSPDGKHAYVTAQGEGGALSALVRNKRTGVLTQLPGVEGCISETGSGGDCADGKALRGASAVAVSRDGKSVYVASLVADAVAVFARLPR